MHSLEYIKSVNDRTTQEAKTNKLQPYVATCDNDINVSKCPQLSFYLPPKWKIVKTYFVDNSGFGFRSEAALTFPQFLTKVKQGKGYAIKEVGQFQVYINEYIKTS